LSVTERDRHELYLEFERLMGTERADTAMALLPPVGWADVVTNHTLDLKLDAIEHRFEAALQPGLRDLEHKLVWAFLGAQMTLAAIILTAVAMIR